MSLLTSVDSNGKSSKNGMIPSHLKVNTLLIFFYSLYPAMILITASKNSFKKWDEIEDFKNCKLISREATA